jgi:hypothetical protein
MSLASEAPAVGAVTINAATAMPPAATTDCTSARLSAMVLLIVFSFHSRPFAVLVDEQMVPIAQCWGNGLDATFH